MSRNTLEHYRKRCRGSRIFIEDRLPAPISASTHSTYRVDPTLGVGSMDILQLGSEVTVGRASYTLTAPFRQLMEYGTGSVGFFVMLSGSVRYTTRSRYESFDSACAWVYDGCRSGSDILYEVPAHKPQVAVSVDVPPSWMDGQSGGDERRPVNGLFTPLAGEGVHQCLAAAQTLLRLRPDSIVARLRMESAALDLAAVLLGLREASQAPLQPRRHRRAVDEAIDILRTELDADHTIASLARRVGLNECDLKTGFRRVTGTTIAAYLRDQRMHYARALIEHDGQSVQQAALAVGYANASHFAAAFRKVHGRAPSSLR